MCPYLKNNEKFKDLLIYIVSINDHRQFDID